MSVINQLIVGVLIGFIFMSFKMGYNYPRYRTQQLCDREVMTGHHFVYQEDLQTATEGFRHFDIQYFLRFHHYEDTGNGIELGEEKPVCIRKWCYKRKIFTELRVNYPATGFNDWEDAKQRDRQTLTLTETNPRLEARHHFEYPSSLSGVRVMIYVNSEFKLVSQPESSSGEDAIENEPNRSDIDGAFKKLGAYGRIEILPKPTLKDKADIFFGQGLYVFPDDTNSFWPVRVTRKYFTDMHR